ncbi:hypothetical protein Tco_0329345 [Tanacetum coccineum]
MKVFTMTMEILLEPTSNKLLVVGNPVKEILLKLNLPDHRSVLTDSKIHLKMDMEHNLGDTLRRKGCDDSFLHWGMLRRNPSGMLHRKVPWSLHFGAFLVQIPCLLLKCSLGP